VLSETLERPEGALIARLRAGDRPTTERFVRAHAGWMLVLAQRYVKDAALAEDCVQDAFLQAFRGIGAFEGRSALKSWLYRIVVNAALMKLRGQHAGGGRLVEELPEGDANGCPFEPAWTEMATPDEILQRKETCELVAAKLLELPDCYRIVLLLRDIEGLSTEETARVLATTEGAVKVRLHRARAAFKRLVAPVLGQYV
jgi:RNA polymerase sigma-70 factor (ECF subfamily)